MRRGSHRRSFTTAVTAAVVEAVVTELSSSAVRRDQPGVDHRTSLTNTDVKGKVIKDIGSTPSSHISK